MGKHERQNKKRYTFQEFKLMHESTEKVIDRRIALNRTNYSISVGMIISVYLLLQWGVTKPDFILLSLALIVIICLFALWFCQAWIVQIKDSKTLNGAKFQVLAEMALLEFSDTPDGQPVTSFGSLNREWEILHEKRDALKHSRFLGMVKILKGGSYDYLLPRGIQAFFLAVLIVIAMLGVANFDKKNMVPTIRTGTNNFTKENINE